MGNNVHSSSKDNSDKSAFTAMSPFCSLLNTLERLNHIHSFDHRRHEEIDNQRKGHGEYAGKDIAAGVDSPAEHDDVCLDSGDDKVVQDNPPVPNR